MKPTVCGATTSFEFANTEDALATALVDKKRWNIQDICTYSIVTTCGAPALDFEMVAPETTPEQTGPFTNNDVFVHYLEHGDTTTQSIALTGADLKKDNTVFVVDDQTKYKVGTLWSLKYEFNPVVGDATKETILIPGDYPATWIQQKNDEYKAFELAKTAFDKELIIYD
jgi:hypothetical protein